MSEPLKPTFVNWTAPLLPLRPAFHLLRFSARAGPFGRRIR
nr:hypothetical protein [Actinomadura geliboluensis]